MQEVWQHHGFVNIWGDGKRMMVLVFHLHKCQCGGAQWLYCSIIHGQHCEMGLGALRDVFFNRMGGIF
ncbi:hypothetical protein [Bartonella rattaustraliani]|uniref:hypothetical protein n=1 Tax=Bartonella rattaustraliani TaxID=481139 RepID=UPI000688FC45|nr:hypothetical protein [Bartonella rattaustraliani]